MLEEENIFVLPTPYYPVSIHCIPTTPGFEYGAALKCGCETEEAGAYCQEEEEEGEDKGGSDERKKGWEAEQTWIHGSPWRVETCKKGCGDLQKC